MIVIIVIIIGLTVLCGLYWLMKVSRETELIMSENIKKVRSIRTTLAISHAKIQLLVLNTTGQFYYQIEEDHSIVMIVVTLDFYLSDDISKLYNVLHKYQLNNHPYITYMTTYIDENFNEQLVLDDGYIKEVI